MLAVARDEALAQGEQVEHELDEDAGVAADVAAIGQDLAVELGGEHRLARP